MKFNTKVIIFLTSVICLSACVFNLKIKTKEDEFGDDLFEAPANAPQIKIKHRAVDEKTTPNATKKKRQGNAEDDDDDKGDKKTLSQKWKELFTVDRSKLVSCPNSTGVILAAFNDLDKKKEKETGALIVAPHKAFDEWSILEQGFGNAAYFFDYLDPTLKDKIAKAFQTAWDTAMKVVPTDSKYEDPYALATMLKGRPVKFNQVNAQENTELLKKLAIIAPSFDQALWLKSIDAFKVNEFLKLWNWDIQSDGSKDQAKSLIDRFDLNGDGRLDTKEYILASIVTNNKILGADQCTNCYGEEIKSLIDPIFYYIDCNSDNWISSEEIWKQLQNIKNGDDFNYYKCIIKDKYYRTSAVNDFILKANKNQSKGQLNVEQFREGVLLAYWMRQVSDDGIVLDDSINRKDNRWKQKTQDKGCEAMKLNIESREKEEAEKGKEKCKKKKTLT